MPGGWQIKTTTLGRKFELAPATVNDLIEKNLRGLGATIAAAMRKTLQPVKFKGRLERSVSTEYAVQGARYQITVGPSAGAPERVFVRFGTKPHWAPIGPLKEWARWKLGSENAAYAVQKSIARRGTSVHIERLGLGDGHGGFNYVGATLARSEVQTAIQRTGKRIPLDIVNAMKRP